MTEKRRPQAIIFEGSIQTANTLMDDLGQAGIVLATRPVTLIDEVHMANMISDHPLRSVRFDLAVIGGGLGQTGLFETINDSKSIHELVKLMNPSARVMFVGGAYLLSETSGSGIDSVPSYFLLPQQRKLRLYANLLC